MTTPVFKPENIPEVMRHLTNRWATWTYAQVKLKNGTTKRTKPPTNPHTGKLASTSVSWWDFNTVERAMERYAEQPEQFKLAPVGAGFLMTQTPKIEGNRRPPEPHSLVLIDLDNCVKDGRIADWAEKILEQCGDTYCEVSPSGNGLRIVGVAPDDVEDRREFTSKHKTTGAGVELYFGKSPRYLTMTGDILETASAEVNPISEWALDWLTETHGTKQSKAPTIGPERRPELLDPLEADLADLSYCSDQVKRFMATGYVPHGDRSRQVLSAAIEVLEATADEQGKLRPDLALTVLGNNKYAMAVALDHRQHNVDKAYDWLWDHHIRPGLAQASPTAGDFEVVRSPEFSADGTPNGSESAVDGPPRLSEFYSDGPSNRYIFSRDNSMWPQSTIDKRFPRMNYGGEAMTASTWCHRAHGVEQTTWVPGYDMHIQDHLFMNGQMAKSPGSRIYNLYRPSTLESGDASQASPWVKHVQLLYPDHYQHLIQWFAFKVQHPGRKVNHALVLGGGQGIGKDSLLHPVIAALGAHNVHEIGPMQVFERFNEWQQSVLLRISEARDMGKNDRYRFYESCKTMLAAPPATLRVDAKFMDPYQIPNVMGVVFTTNYSQSLHLPADDRRHFVVSSTQVRGQGALAGDYFEDLWGFYEAGGMEHVAAYLREIDVTDFDPHKPPETTAAKRAMLMGSVSEEESQLMFLLDVMGKHEPSGLPTVVTLDMLTRVAEAHGDDGSLDDLSFLAASRKLDFIMEGCGYRKVININDRTRGRWKINNQSVYVWGLMGVPDSVVYRAIKDMQVRD